ncbi:hypothetical protein D9M72_529960 [compost metagenome]
MRVRAACALPAAARCGRRASSRARCSPASAAAAARSRGAGPFPCCRSASGAHRAWPARRSSRRCRARRRRGRRAACARGRRLWSPSAWPPRPGGSPSRAARAGPGRGFPRHRQASRRTVPAHRPACPCGPAAARAWRWPRGPGGCPRCGPATGSRRHSPYVPRQSAPGTGRRCRDWPWVASRPAAGTPAGIARLRCSSWPAGWSAPAPVARADRRAPPCARSRTLAGPPACHCAAGTAAPA